MDKKTRSILVRCGNMVGTPLFFVKSLGFSPISEFSSDHAPLRSWAVPHKHRPFPANSSTALGSYGPRNRKVYSLL
jgi:hypothetical protein